MEWQSPYKMPFSRVLIVTMFYQIGYEIITLFKWVRCNVCNVEVHVSLGSKRTVKATVLHLADDLCISEQLTAIMYRPRLKRQGSSHRSNDTVKFKTDLQKAALLNVCDERKWILTEAEDDWNVYWAVVGKIRKIFNLESGIRLRDDQIVNHFPNHFELTRKDLMVKNHKRYKKSLEKQGNKASELMNFIPTSYNLPGDYPIFEEEFRKQIIEREHSKKIRKYANSSDTTGSGGGSGNGGDPSSNNQNILLNFTNFNHKQRGSKWILKPSSRAQGAGIFIINRLSQLKKWTNSSKYNNAETYVISKYIEKPLLIGGRKFDLRLYALITSYRPLKVWFYSEGFARFSNVKYTADRDQMNNQEIHLTNVAIQKHCEDYNPNHGNKWSFSNVMLYVESNFGNQRADQLRKQIKDIIIYSCLSVKNVMINDKHCFECYGFDVIIDEALKPWLIEINASPALSATTKADSKFKKKLMFDLFQIVVSSDFPNIKNGMGQGLANWCNKKRVGDFLLIYSENADGEDCHDERGNDEGGNDNDSAVYSSGAYSSRYGSRQKKFKNNWR